MLRGGRGGRRVAKARMVPRRRRNLGAAMERPARGSSGKWAEPRSRVSPAMGAGLEGRRLVGASVGRALIPATVKLKFPMQIEKVYEPQRFEPRWAERWVDEQIFRVEAEPGAPYFSLVIPPPNVTGSLHMGHMFEHSIIDAQIRWRRMTGVKTLWVPGTDHAGIATELMVTRELAKQGIDKRELGRDKFIERVWEWKR